MIIASNLALDAKSAALNPAGHQVFEEASHGNVFLTTVYAAGMRAKDGMVVFFAARSYHLVLLPGETHNLPRA